MARPHQALSRSAGAGTEAATRSTGLPPVDGGSTKTRVLDTCLHLRIITGSELSITVLRTQSKTGEHVTRTGIGR